MLETIFMVNILRQFLNGGDTHKNGSAAALEIFGRLYFQTLPPAVEKRK